MMESSTNYSVLPIKLHKLDKNVRYLYIKPQSGQADAPHGLSIFVAGLPVELHEGALLELFSSFGEVEKLAIHGTRLSAVVLYCSKQGKEAVLKATVKGKTVKLDIYPPEGPRGLKAWVNAHKMQKPGNAELQRQLDEWMEEFETEEERRKLAALTAMEEDGWTVVQRHKGRKKNSSQTGVTVGAVAAAVAAARAVKKRPAEHSNFYRFQQREKRRNELLDLRQKFEEDKRRIAELKAMRKFSPMG